MKAVFLTGLRQMEMGDAPEPTVQKATDVLLKIERVGVCGSDVHYYETGRIGSQVVEYPYITGHECAATVVDVGESVTRVKAGDAVAIDPAVSCHQCAQCKMGRENTCYSLRFLGTPGQGHGCLCEYLVMPEESCYPTHGAITLEQAVMCEPLSIAAYSVQQAKLPKNANVAILGAGPIGLCTFASAKAENINTCYMTDKIDARIETARKAGATWAGNPDKQNIVEEILKQHPHGVDVAFECAGEQEAIDQCIDLLRPGGTLILTGIPRVDRVSFAIDFLRRKEITIVDIRRQNQCTQKAIDLIASGKVDVDFMITHHFPFERTQEAFELVAGYRDGVVKAMIEVSE
ncbi:MAG: alcohol dehydrogenase catalytic domain-containing protein [Sedimentisphaerales bacterium]|jgi:L-iditol 2-dehydrogenase